MHPPHHDIKQIDLSHGHLVMHPPHHDIKQIDLSGPYHHAVPHHPVAVHHNSDISSGSEQEEDENVPPAAILKEDDETKLVLVGDPDAAGLGQDKKASTQKAIKERLHFLLEKVRRVKCDMKAVAVIPNLDRFILEYYQGPGYRVLNAAARAGRLHPEDYKHAIEGLMDRSRNIDDMNEFRKYFYTMKYKSHPKALQDIMSLILFRLVSVARCMPTTTKLTVYRGMREEGLPAPLHLINLRTGIMYMDAAPLSTSQVLAVAEQFKNAQASLAGYVVTLEVEAKTPSIRVTGSGESEVLFPPGTRWRYDHIDLKQRTVHGKIFPTHSFSFYKPSAVAKEFEAGFSAAIELNRQDFMAGQILPFGAKTARRRTSTKRKISKKPKTKVCRRKF